MWIAQDHIRRPSPPFTTGVQSNTLNAQACQLEYVQYIWGSTWLHQEVGWVCLLDSPIGSGWGTWSPYMVLTILICGPDNPYFMSLLFVFSYIRSFLSWYQSWQRFWIWVSLSPIIIMNFHMLDYEKELDRHMRGHLKT